MKDRVSRLPVLAVCAALAAAGCDDPGLSPERAPQVTLSLAVPGGASGVRTTLVPVTDPSGRSLEIGRVRLLLREVELKRAEDDDCGAEDDDRCEKFAAGPMLVDLPLDGGVVTPFSETIRPGVYDELELRIQEPEDDEGDRARFRREHPEWPREATVRVTGTFDAGRGAGAEPFDVFLAVDAKIERRLSPPLVVDAETDPASVNVTLALRVEEWFRTRGGRLVDPRALGDDDLAELVEENLERSLEVFRDDDRDGRHGRGGDADDDRGDDHGGSDEPGDGDGGDASGDDDDDDDESGSGRGRGGGG